MIKILIMMYVTLLPPILSGVLNMVWCKLPIFKFLKIPMDNNKCFFDGKRLFGDNKTWKGFCGYIFLNLVISVMWGYLCSLFQLNHFNYFYINYDNCLLYNVLIGLLLGLGYALFELPNSFVKRRLDIEPGKTIGGLKKIIFIFLDQADSVFGCCLVVWFFYDLGLSLYLIYVLVGAFTHIVFNMFLYFLKLRKNIF